MRFSRWHGRLPLTLNRLSCRQSDFSAQAHSRPGPIGPPPLSSGYVNLVGLRVAQLRLNIAGDGRTERFREIAAEFASQGGCDCDGRQRSSCCEGGDLDIPIGFALAVDPIGSGMVDLLARPGGNVTGVSLQATETAGKRVELLRQILPGLRRIAVIANVSYPASVLEVAEVREVARKSGFFQLASGSSGARILATRSKGLGTKTQALYVCPSALFNANMARINTLALGARLPTINALREYVEAGGFMSYGANNTEQFRRAGETVDKILKGTKPADLPVEQPTAFELVINLTTAKALGLKFQKLSSFALTRSSNRSMSAFGT